MFGPFSLADSLRVYRLQRRGVSLDLEWDLTQPRSPLREAWLAFFTQQAMGRPAYVLRSDPRGDAFVQVCFRPHQAAADIAFLSPSLAEDRRAGRVWTFLLDGACADIAARGIQRVFAVLPESGGEVDVFHQSGFALYSGEDIYRLAHPSVRAGGLPAADPSGQALKVRPQRLEDWPALQKLCVAVTPQRVRQAEGGIEAAIGAGRPCRRYVLPGGTGDDLVAALALCPGELASWMRIVVHPDAQIAVEALVGWGLAALDDPTKPLYCMVRRYEGGVKVPLEASGFELHATRALLVKQTVAWVKSPVPELVPALKGGAEPVPPAYHINE